MSKILGMVSLLMAIVAHGDAPLPLAAFPQSTLQIVTSDARVHRFKVWIANDDRLRQQGLMFVKDLPANAGMLFIYEQPQRIAMWMKNTFIPLDMIFIRADGRIASVVANTKPHSLDTIQADEDVIAVLELKGGTAAALNIRKGAMALHPLFKPQRPPA